MQGCEGGGIEEWRVQDEGVQGYRGRDGGVQRSKGEGRRSGGMEGWRSNDSVAAGRDLAHCSLIGTATYPMQEELGAAACAGGQLDPTPVRGVKETDVYTHTCTYSTHWESMPP